MRLSEGTLPATDRSAAAIGAMAGVALVVAAAWLVMTMLGGGPSGVVAAVGAGEHGAVAGVDGATRARVTEAYGRLPLAFEANRGQQPADVRFLARAAGGTLALTGDGATLALGRSGHLPAASVHLRFPGSSGSATLSAQRQLPGTVSYLTAGRRVAGAPTFGRVAYRGVWPGIDAVFYGNQRRIEYDFVVAPGADAAKIRLSFDGERSARVAANGDLLLTLAGGRVVRQLAPVAYQHAGGHRRAVHSRYAVTGAGAGAVRIALGPYDHSRRLIVDPVLNYATYVGGGLNDVANAIAVDAAGSAYITGVTTSTDFVGTSVGLQPTNGGGFNEGFVTKLNPAGTAALYSTYLGGSGADQGIGIAVDSSGSAIVAGVTSSTNFPTTPGAQQAAFGGGDTDAFVTKLNPSGTALVYSTYLGGPGPQPGGASEDAKGIAVDATGAAYVTGQAYAGYPTTPGAFANNTSTTVRGAYATKLSASGALVYSTFLVGAGAGTSVGQAIKVDAAGSAYVAGSAVNDGTLPTTPGAFQTTYGGGSADAFVAKLATDGSHLVYSTLVGGDGPDVLSALALDGAGRVYAAGLGRPASPNSAYPTTPDAILSPATPGFNGAGTVFSVVNADGTALDYSSFVGGTSNGFTVIGLAIDGAGTAYFVGQASSNASGFPLTPDALKTTRSGGFLSILRPGASSYIYSSYVGGAPGGDFLKGVALDPAGGVFVAGVTSTTGLATPGALRSAPQGADAFVQRYEPIVTAPPPTAPAVTSGAAGGVTDTGALVSGTVNPAGLSTTYVFEYGTSTAFGSISAPAGAGAGSSDVAVSAQLAGLAAGTRYYYRVVATSSGGTSTGAVRTFKTTGGTPVAPVAVTLPAGSAGTTTAGLAGQVNPSGSPTVFTFEYGTTTSFGSITPVVALDDANALESVSASLSGLASDTTYYYRVVATNAGGTAVGTVQRFATGPGGTPIVTTAAATDITATSARLTGTVDAHGLQTSFTFAYGPVSAPLTSISAVDNAGAFQGPQPVSLPVTGLTPGTTYVYRTVATNSAGTSIGTIRSFTTTAGT